MGNILADKSEFEESSCSFRFYNGYIYKIKIILNLKFLLHLNRTWSIPHDKKIKTGGDDYFYVNDRYSILNLSDY